MKLAIIVYKGGRGSDGKRNTSKVDISIVAVVGIGHEGHIARAEVERIKWFVVLVDAAFEEEVKEGGVDAHVDDGRRKDIRYFNGPTRRLIGIIVRVVFALRFGFRVTPTLKLIFVDIIIIVAIIFLIVLVAFLTIIVELRRSRRRIGVAHGAIDELDSGLQGCRR